MTIKAHSHHSVCRTKLCDKWSHGWKSLLWFHLCGLACKAWYSFSRLFDLFLASKRLISFITIHAQISSCAKI